MVINLVYSSCEDDAGDVTADKKFGMYLETNVCVSSISKVGMTKSKL